MRSFLSISLSIVGVLLTTCPLQARLGDTERDCILRYGRATFVKHVLPLDPLIAGARHVTYVHEGWEIRVALVDGVVAAQEYRKPYNHANGSKILDHELKAILTAEKATYAWKSPHVDTSKGITNTIANVLMSPYSSRIWDRTDGAKATLIVQTTLVLESAEALRVKAALEKEKAAAKLKRVPKF